MDFNEILYQGVLWKVVKSFELWLKFGNNNGHYMKTYFWVQKRLSRESSAGEFLGHSQRSKFGKYIRIVMLCVHFLTYYIYPLILDYVFIDMCRPLLLNLHLVDYQKVAPSLGRPSTDVWSISEHVSTTHRSHRGVCLVQETSKTSDRLGIFPCLCDWCAVYAVVPISFSFYGSGLEFFIHRTVGNIFFKFKCTHILWKHNPDFMVFIDWSFIFTSFPL